METNWVLVGILLVLLIVDCSGTDLEVKPSSNNGLDLQKPVTVENNNVTSNEGIDKSNLGKVDQVKKGDDEVGNLEKLKSANQSESQRADNAELGKGSSTEKSKVKDGDDKKEKKETKKVLKDEGKKGASGSKEGGLVEECYSSNSCTDEENKLVACLRVPGNESPAHSLLIQNKGKVPLTVTISAPDFVKLEETKVQVPEMQHKEVKVSIGKGESGNLIVLKTGNGLCNLDFRDLVTQNSRKEAIDSSKSAYNFLTQTPTIAILSLAVLLIVALSWTCISIRRRHLSSIASKYQKLDRELPVSGVEKPQLRVDDGWDNSWGDSWDDEEAPSTPSMPLTPSLSSKGLAPRRSNKDGWKD